MTENGPSGDVQPRTETQSGHISRRDFLISLLIASGAVSVGPSGLLAATRATDLMYWPMRGTPLIADEKRGTVKMYTEVNLKNLTQTNPHWGIGCQTGKFAEKFILSSPAEPLDFHDALVSIGAKPGNNLALDSYGTFVEGDEIIVTALWTGLKKPVDIKDLFCDATGKGFNIRFGGNRPAAADKKTGCLTCLESCPIAITSNAVYPHISPATRSSTPNSRFRGNPEVLPTAAAFPVVVLYGLKKKA
jgi:hypothetical protein